MKRNLMETVLGGVVILVAILFVMFGYKTANVGTGAGGYQIAADFTGVGGLKPGDEVQISGVKVGTISNIDIMPDTFLARVNMSIDTRYQLPADTAALISSESLLGGRYMALEPGGDEELLEEGDVIQFTQAPQNLEQLLGQFIFSMQGADDKQ
jgi:phospholipid/cholesterol/gamma-HCH transport system substrate-binding protein